VHKERDEGLSPGGEGGGGGGKGGRGRGHERRVVTCMLDMCDLHDFCYRDAPSLAPPVHIDIWRSWGTRTVRAVSRRTRPRVCVRVSLMLLTSTEPTAIGGCASYCRL